MSYDAVDCQGFAGGFTLGMVQAGFHLVGKREMKGGFGVANCEANRHLLGHDWKTEAVDPADWSVPFGGAPVVFGNPPCSGFSVMSSKEFRGADSSINHCMWAFAEYAAKVRPVIAVFESVQLACKEGEGRELMKALRARLEELTGLSYHLYHVKHNAYSIGGSAMRKRYFWLVSQVPFGIEEPGITRYPVLNEVIGDLRNLPTQWEAQPYDDTEVSWWATSRRNDGLNGVAGQTVDGHIGTSSPLHTRIGELIEWSGMRPREAIQNALRRCYEEHGSLPPSWKHNEAKFVANDFFHGFTAPCRWDGEYPTRVITGAALGTVIHPTLDRTITHREAARILGFPDDWLIHPLKGVGGLNLTWGKGITVDCGKWIGEWIKNALDGNPGSYAGEVVGERENMIDCTNTWQTGGKIVTKSSKMVTVPRQKVARVRASQGGNEVSEENVEGAVESNRRGRPRPETTLERDAQTRALLEEGPITKTGLAEKLGVKDSEAYLSLHRLQKQGVARRVRNGSAHTWEFVPEDERATVVEIGTAESVDTVPDAPASEPTAEVAENAEAEQAPVYGI